MAVTIKVCGVTNAFTAHNVVEAGANMIGLVFYDRSPRHLRLSAAMQVASAIPPAVMRVGLFVDPCNTELEKVLSAVALDMIQLQGKESAARVAEIKSRFGLPIMKAFSISRAEDLEAVRPYEDHCDWLLFDGRPAKPPVVPGSHGVPFDWGLLAGRAWRRPWMLSGGLKPKNVAEAIRSSGAKAVDVSSGVETSPGAKNAGLVREFIAATL